jgi:hypothetical protein
MHKDFYNAEHYPDPTAYEALMNIMREERQRALSRRYDGPVRPRETPGYFPFKEVFERENFIPT